MRFVTAGWFRQKGLTPDLELSSDLQLSPITFDSREVSPGETFWAIRGNRDGHEFVSDAFNRGANCAVVDESWAKSTASAQIRHRCIPVNNTGLVLTQAARLWRDEFRGEVIGITGTNGKTSTKDLILKVLGTRFSVGGTVGNHNNRLGVPLTLLNLPNDLQFCVIEMGASYPGEIGELCQITSPNHGLVTSIGKAHLEGFGSLSQIAYTKGQLYDALSLAGIAFVPVDDPLCVIESAGKDRRVGYGFTRQKRDWPGKLCKGNSLALDDNGCASFKVESALIQLSIPGHSAALTALAAIAVACEFGMRGVDCADVIRAWTGIPGRAQLIRFDEVSIYDDSYNANPDSMRAALDTICAMRSQSRAVILGEMAELGVHTESEHRSLMNKLQGLNLKKIALVGRAWTRLDGDLTQENVSYYESVEEILPVLIDFIRGKDLILVKGSRSTRLDLAVTYLQDQLS